MKLEDQVVSLELAKKLKELGFEQESLFYWYELFEGETSVGVSSKANVDVLEGEEQIIFVETSRGFHSVNEDLVEEPISAYTVAELGEMLPENIPKRSKQGFDMLQIWKYTGWNIEYHTTFEPPQKRISGKKGGKEADSRAEMLIYLAENKLLNPHQP